MFKAAIILSHSLRGANLPITKEQHFGKTLLQRSYLIILLSCVGFFSLQKAHAFESLAKTSFSKIPGAIPKHEYQSPTVNPHSYKVRGKHYHVLKSNKGYHQHGIASWYGKEFHKKKTATGETFNMYEYSAASKHLRIPSYVEVTNLSNGRKIIAKVHDRGPFVENRLIDLSYGAALKLDIVKPGTAMVDVKVIDPETYYASLGKQQNSQITNNNFNDKIIFADSIRKINNNGHDRNIFMQAGSALAL